MNKLFFRIMVFISGIMFLGCYTENLYLILTGNLHLILRDYQDVILPVNSEKPLVGYIIHDRLSNYWLQVTPWRELNIIFLSETRDGYRISYTNIMIEICTRKPYERLYITEISGIINGEKIIFAENKIIKLPEMLIVKGGIHSNPIRDGESVLYMPKWRYNGYSWQRIYLAHIDTRDFINRKRGKFQEMTLKQIYHFDDEPEIIQEWDYKIKCGVDNIPALTPYPKSKSEEWRYIYEINEN
jgi:hypothetical protein